MTRIEDALGIMRKRQLITLVDTITLVGFTYTKNEIGENVRGAPHDLRTLKGRVEHPGRNQTWEAGEIVQKWDAAVVCAYDADLSGGWQAIRTSRNPNLVWPVGDNLDYEYRTLTRIYVSTTDVGGGNAI